MGLTHIINKMFCQGLGSFSNSLMIKLSISIHVQEYDSVLEIGYQCSLGVGVLEWYWKGGIDLMINTLQRGNFIKLNFVMSKWKNYSHHLGSSMCESGQHRG